ncbi:uncharacterized protein TNIN_237861 [Trichonephila inaurata madagascariensis]|uniref:Uncharacterized protein n=1 Tax=Trichonephila inaurata madagascariensis TaxID=2747483 RepID=A0A8X6Y8B0_9ARAC|nr:uncharacterized protein TNIN_237861 [Trichonephila inaurata madagascariensis]
MNPDELCQFSEHFKEQWLYRIKLSVDQAEGFDNMCEGYETLYCLVNTVYSKLLALDLTNDGSRCKEAKADLRQIHLLVTKIYKLMKSMRFMRNITRTNLEFVSSHVIFENVTLSQLHEAIAIIEKFESAVWLLGETISRAETTISEYQKEMEEIIKTFPKIGLNE